MRPPACGWSKYFCQLPTKRLRPPENRGLISSIIGSILRLRGGRNAHDGYLDHATSPFGSSKSQRLQVRLGRNRPAKFTSNPGDRCWFLDRRYFQDFLGPKSSQRYLKFQSTGGLA